MSFIVLCRNTRSFPQEFFGKLILPDCINKASHCNTNDYDTKNQPEYCVLSFRFFFSFYQPAFIIRHLCHLLTFSFTFASCPSARAVIHVLLISFPCSDYSIYQIFQNRRHNHAIPHLCPATVTFRSSTVRKQ